MPEVTPKEQWQIVKDNFFRPDLILDPRFVEQYFINNIIQRTLTQLVGKAGHVGIPIEATSAGELKVATVGTGFEHNETFADADLSDNNWDELEFTETVSRVDVIIEDKRAQIKRTPRTGDPYEGVIQIPPGAMYSFDCSTAKIAIKNVNAGENPTYQIIGWY